MLSPRIVFYVAEPFVCTFSTSRSRGFKFVFTIVAVVPNTLILIDATDRVVYFSPGVPKVGWFAFRIPLCYPQPHSHNVVFAYVFGFAGRAAETGCHSFGKFCGTHAALLDMLLDAIAAIRSARTFEVAVADFHARRAGDT